MRILVVRPEPGAAATAARLRALGHEPIVVPLLATEALDWQVPASRPDAVIITSAAAVRHAGPAAADLQHLPLWCVGEATAAAARSAGWRDVAVGPGTLQGLLDQLASTGPHDLLHLAGEDRTAVTLPEALAINRITLYRARLLPLPMLVPVDGILLHSPRTARHVAAEWDRLGGRRDLVKLFAISPLALAAAGPGWRAGHAAPTPDDAALLAMLAKAG